MPGQLNVDVDTYHLLSAALYIIHSQLKLYRLMKLPIGATRETLYCKEVVH